MAWLARYNASPQRRESSLRYARREDVRARRKMLSKTEAYKRTRRNNLYKRKYGISLEQYEAMFQSQSGSCAICRKDNPSGRRLHVDHCHTTGTVRELLCYRCNAMIGYSREDVGILRVAVDYLVRHESRNHNLPAEDLFHPPVKEPVGQNVGQPKTV